MAEQYVQSAAFRRSKAKMPGDGSTGIWRWHFLLDVAEQSRIKLPCEREFVLSPGGRITTEANPGTLDLERLAAYRRMGLQPFKHRGLRALTMSFCVP